MIHSSGMPRVSVLIACFNYGHFLPDAIESIRCQTYPADHLEIIVVDDGSTDDTAHIVRQWGSAIHYRYQPNQGMGQAYNTGLSIATGEYICLLDADDSWHSEKIRYVVDAFQSHPDCALVQHRLMDISSDHMGDPELKIGQPSGHMQTREDFLNSACRFVSTSGLSFRRGLVPGQNPFPKDLIMCVDAYLCHRAVFQGPVWTLDADLGRRRFHKANWSSYLTNADRLGIHIRAREIIGEQIREFLNRFHLSFSQSSFQGTELEDLRDRVVYLALKGKGREARSKIHGFFKSVPDTPYNRFKRRTLEVASVAPRIYLFFLEAFYRRFNSLTWFRKHFMPERA